MLSRKVIFISVQPDVPYFHWQVEVMLNNFIRLGINPSWIEVIFSYTNIVSKECNRLVKNYSNVKFFFYKKTVLENHGYIPILRPDSLEQHFRAFPNLKNEHIFYHDSDIIFRQLPDFDTLTESNTWYVSDTVSYIGSDYIKSKSEKLFHEMCELVNIDPVLVENNQKNSGGAQYLMFGIDSDFWKKVKEDCLNLYVYMRDVEFHDRSRLSEEQLKKFNPIQKWCSDMWAVLWNGLKMGNEVRISSELDFSWGTSDESSYNRCNIMHNAGVTTSSGGLFYKADFINKDPFKEDLTNIKKGTASYKYVEAIIYAKENRIG